MDNASIARRFHRLAALMDIRGDDPFRLRSYRNAAEAIETWPYADSRLPPQGIAGLQAIPGVVRQSPARFLNFWIVARSTPGNGSFCITPESVPGLLEPRCPNAL